MEPGIAGSHLQASQVNHDIFLFSEQLIGLLGMWQ